MIPTSPGRTRRPEARPYQTTSVSLAELGGLEADWIGLATRTSAPAWTLARGWYTAWRAAFSGSDPLVAYCARTGGPAPPQSASSSGAARRLHAAANVHSPWFGLLAGCDAARDAVFGAILDDSPQELELRHVHPATARIQEAFPQSGGRAVDTGCSSRAPRRCRTSTSGAIGSRPMRVPSPAGSSCGTSGASGAFPSSGPVSFEWLTPEPDEVLGAPRRRPPRRRLGLEAPLRLGDPAQPQPDDVLQEAARWAASGAGCGSASCASTAGRSAFDYGFEQDGVISAAQGRV